MEYLTRAASKDFLRFSKDSYFLGIIGWTHFSDRLRVLDRLCPSDDPCRRYIRVVLAEDGEGENPWSHEQEREIGGSEEESAGSSETGVRRGVSPDDDYYYFISGVAGLKNWIFHQYDDDYFPSIPHGHWQGRSKSKLDPYLGWVYDNSRQIRRESREIIIKLWNDIKFRHFALIAIDYYIEANPHYGGWRVRNPRRLPRIR